MSNEHIWHRFTVMAKALIAFTALSLPVAAYAFKIDTHLWIAQQVFNDLSDDGQITVKLNGRSISIPVADEVLEAVLNHKDAFFLGNIGPDALPDVVAGQMTVHPGVTNGWKTNDWLMHLMEKSKGDSLGTALTYGYLSHASADVFSHTYANQYSGGIFLLTDGETLVEQRHFALEAYIANHSPPFLDHNGVDQGPRHTLVTPSDDIATFVRDVLIYDPQASAEYAKEPSTQHLPAYLSYRNAIKDAANDDIWRDIDTAVVQAMAANSGYAISAKEARALIDFLNTKVIPAIQKHQDLDQKTLNKLNGYVNRIDAAHVSALNDTLDKFSDLQRTIHQKLLKREKLLAVKCDNIAKKACKAKYWYSSKKRKKCEKLACKPFNDAQNAIKKINDELDAVQGLWEQQIATANELHDLAFKVKDSSLSMMQSIADLAQIISSDTSPVKAVLDNWVGDLDFAMKEYVKAAANTMIYTMDPNVGNLEYGAVTPMADWYNCYHLTLMGVPAPVGTGDCGFRGQFDETMNALDEMVTIIDDATSLGTYVNPSLDLPTPHQVRTAVTALQEEAKQALKDAAINEFKKLIPDEVRDIIDLMSVNMTDSRLQYYYTKKETTAPKNLIMIRDIAKRVKAEMHVKNDGSFDSSKYAVVYDAIVLAKLSMLDNAGLIRLAQLAGVNGYSLFSGVDNIIANSVASIDGNHHWMDKAPPYPNAKGGSYVSPRLDPSYPASPGSYGGPVMLKLWEPQVRDKLFRSLFIGPLSPGIDSPEELHLTAILPSDYPYRPCKANPFPDDSNDRTCGPITPLPEEEVVPPSPMVATAYLDSENMACAWYANRTLSCGSINDLDSTRKPYPYSLPPGYTPADIVGTAWVDSYHMICAWYSNGMASCGTTYDLDSIRAPYRYTLAPGYRPSDVRGIGWVSSPNAMACAVYKDRKFSCGTTRDLDSVAGADSYGLPYGYSPNDILSFDWVSKYSMGCVWYQLGTVSCGSKENLSNIRPPSRYSTTQ